MTRASVRTWPRLAALLLGVVVAAGTGRCGTMDWKAGIAKAVITPEKAVWLAGYGSRRAPEGKLHDLWVKVLALEDHEGRRAALVTTDHMGIPKGIYESLVRKLKARCRLDRADVMITFSHNHCGPRLRGDLVDYYPIDAEQTRLVAEYSDRFEAIAVDAVERALAALAPARLSVGEGRCTFAINRRNNPEAEVPRLLASGTPLKGPVDHSVPVLAVHRGERLVGLVFGYACHPTTLGFRKWCGDYPGFAQLALEKSHPGATAMFVNTCGGDQNPLPRRKVELCEQYGLRLADAVGRAIEQPAARRERWQVCPHRANCDGPLRPAAPVPSGLRAAFEFVDLAYQKVMTRAELEKAAGSGRAIHARWGRRMLERLDAGETFASAYPYPVQAWRLGDKLLLIGMGGEAVVDWALRFKREFGPGTWVCGYASDLVAYIPSRRVWEEGGYEGGPHLDEYGRPALRWAGDIEDRIAAAVHRVVRQVGR